MSTPNRSDLYRQQPPLRQQLLTWANLATSLRLVFGLAAFCVALIEKSDQWNYIGLAIYWSLDILDGQLARRLNQETLFGAQYDILADRIQVSFFYLVYASMHPDKLIVIALFLMQFMVFDHFLSNQFMRWRILSPNYFHRVDQQIYDWLWSPLGKAANTGMVTLLIIFVPSIWPPLVVTVSLIAIRVHCMVRVMSLPVPSLPTPPVDIHAAERMSSERVEDRAAKADARAARA